MRIIKKYFSQFVKHETSEEPVQEFLPSLEFMPYTCHSCQDTVDQAFRDGTMVVCEFCMKKIVQENVDAVLLEIGKREAVVEVVYEYWESKWERMPDLSLVRDYSEEPQVSGFIIIHTRATDRVVFGPFKTQKEVEEWYRRVGSKRGVSGSMYPMMNPNGDPADFWWIPSDMPWEETLKPKKDREYIP